MQYSRDQISRRFANTQSGGETFRVGPLGVWGHSPRPIQPRGLRRKFVRPAFSGVRGGASMGPLRCRRWCTQGTQRDECVSKDSARQSTTLRRKISIGEGAGMGGVGKIWLTPTGDIHGPCVCASPKLANIRVPARTGRRRQWWSMAIFLFTTHTIVVENNNRQAPTFGSFLDLFAERCPIER